MLIVRPSASGSRGCEAVGAKVIGEHADEDVSAVAVFELIEIQPQSERAFELGKAALGIEQRYLEFPELRGPEAQSGREK